MIKYLTFFMLTWSFYVAAAPDISVFGERFTTDNYVFGPWGGPMNFSESPSLAALGVERYDVVKISLQSRRFDEVLNALGFKKAGQIKQEIPVAIIMYSDQLLMDQQTVSFDDHSVAALSVYTLSSIKYGSTTHRLYEPRQSKLKPVKDMTFKTLDTPECSTAFEFGLHWLADEEAPQHATALIINNIEIGLQVDNGDKEFGDFRKILKKVKVFDKKGSKKRKAKSVILNKSADSLFIDDSTTQSRNCGNTPACPRGEVACNVFKNVCKGDSGGGGWIRVATESIDTIIDSLIHDSMLYDIKSYLSDSSESSLVIRAYDAWDHVKVDTTSIPLYYKLLPALMNKHDLMSTNVSSAVVVVATVDDLMQQIISYHRGTGDSTFQSHLDYVQSKVNQYQMMTVAEVNSTMYPTTMTDPFIE
jgi:hypothetical protein